MTEIKLKQLTVKVSDDPDQKDPRFHCSAQCPYFVKEVWAEDPPMGRSFSHYHCALTGEEFKFMRLVFGTRLDMTRKKSCLESDPDFETLDPDLVAKYISAAKSYIVARPAKDELEERYVGDELVFSVWGGVPKT